DVNNKTSRLIRQETRWKKRFLLITAEGSLLVCHDASSPPSQLVLLQNSCEAIVEGKEILDLPKLPSGGGRDCCFQEGTTLALLHSTPPTLTALTLKWQTLILTLLIVVDLLSNNLLVGDCGYGYI
uniref:PH domain-containing protein n=1 Tax=Pundamilia nyererei TaxID=303518 RepID=A0A3B4G723_9CICH